MYKQYGSDYAKSDIGLKCIRKTMSKRRNLGFNELNQYFNNSEAHHINKNDVIYMPKEWHIKGHNVFTSKNMEAVNTIAFFFLTMQNINNTG